MCGICGQYNFATSETVSPDVISRMAYAIRHRGPDDDGFYVSGNIGLGFRRLSIIDLGLGHQPMADSEEKIWLVFNGEIYNFKELRAELETLGHRFRTNSDTEVIIYAYKQWGEDLLLKLNGMFGLAVWDSEREKLILARDRMGIKPVYYALDGGTVLFGSELRAIIAAGNIPTEIDPDAIALFLRHRYVPSPFTLLKGIRKLAAGTCLVIERDRAPQVKRWWKFAPKPFEQMPSSDEAAESLLHLYKQAVGRQLVSDVPLGLLLSGGQDSGLLLGLMKQFGPTWDTFSVGYGSSYADDELAFASETARLFDVPHAEVRIDQKVFEETLDRIAEIMEEPVTASSIVPMYHLCRRARQDVTVALMGQGPDELLGGYTRHLGSQYGYMWRALPGPVRSLLGSTLQAATRKEAVKRALYSLDRSDRLERYEQILSVISGPAIAALFRDGIFPGGQPSMYRLWKDDLYPLMQGTDELGGLQFLEIRSSLPDELLNYADKISMATSLEIRVPYLDQDVVEYVERLDASFKVHNGTRKWLHRKVAASFLPAEVIQRKKRGFMSDIDGWFRDSLAGKMESLLRDRESVIYDYLRPEAVDQLINEHKRGVSDNSKLLFSLVILEQTLRLYTSHRQTLTTAT
jgi:asparagine synthase (glutamine-hydrolysing)